MSADYSQIIADDVLVIGEKKAAYATYPHAELTRTIIGAAFEVHRILGRGFLENVYETTLLHELRSREVKAEPQAPMSVDYKVQSVGTYFADILVEGVVICEIKAVEAIIDPHLAQLLNYLKATHLQVGLFLNFGAKSLQINAWSKPNDPKPKK